MAKEGLRYLAFSRRALLIAAGQGLVMTILGGRLYYLSVVQGEEYRLRADENRIANRMLLPDRGQILDRFGEPLASNKRDFQVYLIPEQAGDVAKTLDQLGRVITLEDRQVAAIERQISRQRRFLPVSVAQNLSWPDFSRVNASVVDLPGILPDEGRIRYYPSGHLVSHIVGYVAPARDEDLYEDRDPMLRQPGFRMGRQGLERTWDRHLRGAAGQKKVEVNSVGREIRELPPRDEPINGDDLILTIDRSLQDFTVKRTGEEAAGVVVLDINTGDILSLASTPTYDPNDFIKGMSNENWQSLLEDPRKPLVNKAIGGSYPPGSTFKMVVALAALENGILTPDTKHYCNGKHNLGGHTFHCWQTRGHGSLDLNEAIAKSCDVYFYNVAEKLDIDDLAGVARRFGLGQPYNVGIEGERTGLVPDRDWKRGRELGKWHLGETLNVSIGQGQMLATPLQLAVMTARLASNRKVTPRLVRGYKVGDAGEEPVFDDMDMTPRDFEVMQRSMASVMEPGGTAMNYARSKTAPKISGKTGTAQVRRITMAEREEGVLENDELPWKYRDHGLFVGFAPRENPRYAVAVLMQHGGGSSAAVPVASDILDYAIANQSGDKQGEIIDRVGEASVGSEAGPAPVESEV